MNNKNLFVNICKVVEIGGILTLGGMGLKLCQELGKTKNKLNETEIILNLTKIENILHKAKERRLEKELEELKAKRK